MRSIQLLDLVHSGSTVINKKTGIVYCCCHVSASVLLQKLISIICQIAVLFLHCCIMVNVSPLQAALAPIPILVALSRTPVYRVRPWVWGYGTSASDAERDE